VPQEGHESLAATMIDLLSNEDRRHHLADAATAAA